MRKRDDRSKLESENIENIESGRVGWDSALPVQNISRVFRHAESEADRYSQFTLSFYGDSGTYDKLHTHHSAVALLRSQHVQ